MITFIQNNAVPVLVSVIACLLIFSVLRDIFAVVIQPRYVTGRALRSFGVYRLLWAPYAGAARRIRSSSRREVFLRFYGPLAMLFRLSVWAMGLVISFALLQWTFGSALTTPTGPSNFGIDLYMSGTTFFTLGLGDIFPHAFPARVFTVMEAGTGLGMLAVVIGYLPVIYQAYSERERILPRLDTRAGSPPIAVQMLCRYSRTQNKEALNQYLYDWEGWITQLLESHISHPYLAFFRPLHEGVSWLAALTAMLDACALLIVGVEGFPAQQAQLTFALARHAAVDLIQNLQGRPVPTFRQLQPSDMVRIRTILAEAGAPLTEGSAAEKRLTDLRSMYEPFVIALAELLLMPLPDWLPAEYTVDDWQTSPYDFV
jgi:Ion channel